MLKHCPLIRLLPSLAEHDLVVEQRKVTNHRISDDKERGGRVHTRLERDRVQRPVNSERVEFKLGEIASRGNKRPVNSERVEFKPGEMEIMSRGYNKKPVNCERIEL